MIAALLAFVALKSSMAGVFQRTRPALALAWQPNQAVASANLAQRMIGAGRAADGRALAEAALARDVVNATAYTALGLAAEADGNLGEAARLMALAHAMSRRERVAEVWLIRNAIRVGDFDAAVRHFDIAMRTSQRGASELTPLLVAATADPRMVTSIARALGGNPGWKVQFFSTLVQAGPVPERMLQLGRGRLDPAVPEERILYIQMIRRLVQLNRFDLAWLAFREARPGTADAAAGRPRDPDFAGASGFAPFDWQISEQPDLTALRQPRRDGRPGFELALVAEGGRTGEVARQLVRLPAGRYELQFETGAVPAAPSERPLVSLLCPGSSTPLYSARPERAGEPTQRVRAVFTIGGACRWQWLTIAIGSAETPASYPWIANISVRPLG